MPPFEGAYLDPNSDEYIQKLFEVLELNGSMYSHVDPSTMSAFKEILRKSIPQPFIYQVHLLVQLRAFIITLTQVIPHQFTSYHTRKAQLSYVLSRMSCSKCYL